MDTTSVDQAVKAHKWQIFSIKDWIKGLEIKRAMRTMLLAVYCTVDGNTLASDTYPVTIDKITAESGYSRSQTFEVLNDLEKAGLVERIRHRRQLPTGEWINDPTTYRIIVDTSEREAIAALKATEPPRERHPKRERTPQQKAQLTEPTTVQEAPEAPLPPLAPIPVPERVKVNVAPALVDELRRPPQLPSDDVEVTEFGNEIIAHMEEAIAEVADVAKPRTIAAARIGVQALKYSLAVHALNIRDEYLIEECEIFESIYEWARKCVAKNVSYYPSRLAGILRTFFDGKGNGIRNMRQTLARS